MKVLVLSAVLALVPVSAATPTINIVVGSLVAGHAPGVLCACGAVYDDGVLLGDWSQEAAKPAPAPALTVEQKQAIQILAQRIELSQLRAQAAQAEFEKAGAELGKLLQSLQKDGFELNLQTLEYVKKTEQTKKKDGSQ